MSKNAPRPKTPETIRVDLLAIRNEVIEYLAANSVGRQGAIADAVGLRRETICSYAQKRGALSNVGHLQRLYDWMLADKKAEKAGLVA